MKPVPEAELDRLIAELTNEKNEKAQVLSLFSRLRDLVTDLETRDEELQAREQSANQLLEDARHALDETRKVASEVQQKTDSQLERFADKLGLLDQTDKQLGERLGMQGERLDGQKDSLQNMQKQIETNSANIGDSLTKLNTLHTFVHRSFLEVSKNVVFKFNKFFANFRSYYSGN